MQGKWTQVDKWRGTREGLRGHGVSEGSSELKDPGKRATITDSKSNGAQS